jgi:glycosyltransferase involved in cell wall biosynthesis
MNITFVLPFSGHQPVGGFKVVYEYANGLVQKGHEVTVVHAPYARTGETALLRNTRQNLVYLAKAVGLSGGYRPSRWFEVSPAVKLRWVPSLHARWIPPADVVVATAWETAEWVAGYPADRGRKFYLIQHLESTFEGADPDRVETTWRLPLNKVVIARWLEAIGSELGEKTYYVPNGLNFRSFGLDIPVTERNPHQLIMLYHGHPWKGSRDGLAAMSMVKERVPQLRATLFGVSPPPAGLPPWIAYVQSPPQATLRRLYNEAAIFVGPSWAEGWPLPPAEAAQCGAALCVTDIGGHREYALAGETALLSPPRQPDALAHNILRLVEDQEQRIEMALRAHDYVQQFTWARAVTALEEHLKTAP